MTAAREKNLPLAIGLNLVLPGAGYVYLGRVLLGLLACLLVVAIMLSTDLMTVVPVWIGLNLIMAIDMWILHKKHREVLQAATLRKCPFCAELIQREARVCKHCGRDVPRHEPAEATVAAVEAPPPRRAMKLVVVAVGAVALVAIGYGLTTYWQPPQMPPRSTPPLGAGGERHGAVGAYQYVAQPDGDRYWVVFDPTLPRDDTIALGVLREVFRDLYGVAPPDAAAVIEPTASGPAIVLRAGGRAYYVVIVKSETEGGLIREAILWRR
jgi:ribosomal protein L32